jgi:hypothetical protein
MCTHFSAKSKTYKLQVPLPLHGIIIGIDIYIPLVTSTPFLAKFKNSATLYHSAMFNQASEMMAYHHIPDLISNLQVI